MPKAVDYNQLIAFATDAGCLDLVKDLADKCIARTNASIENERFISGGYVDSSDEEEDVSEDDSVQPAHISDDDTPLPQKAGEPKVRDPVSDQKLVMAAMEGRATEVKTLLLSRRADARTDNSAGVYWAARNGHTEIVRMFLVEGRANPLARDNGTLFWAEKNGHRDIVAMLVRRQEAIDEKKRCGLHHRKCSHYYNSYYEIHENRDESKECDCWYKYGISARHYLDD